MLVDIMEMFKLLFVVWVFCGQVYIGSSLTEDRDTWTVEKLQVKPSKADALVQFANLVKRSKEQQFHGLMGRSTGITQPMRRGGRRNNGEIFVGLMGKRSSTEDEWDRAQLY